MTVTLIILALSAFFFVNGKIRCRCALCFSSFDSVQYIDTGRGSFRFLQFNRDHDDRVICRRGCDISDRIG